MIFIVRDEHNEARDKVDLFFICLQPNLTAPLAHRAACAEPAYEPTECDRRCWRRDPIGEDETVYCILQKVRFERYSPRKLLVTHPEIVNALPDYQQRRKRCSVATL